MPFTLIIFADCCVHRKSTGVKAAKDIDCREGTVVFTECRPWASHCLIRLHGEQSNRRAIRSGFLRIDAEIRSALLGLRREIEGDAHGNWGGPSWQRWVTESPLLWTT